MKPDLSLQKGLTLVEILLAIAILGYVIFAVAGLFHYIALSTQASELSTLAANYAREKMEDIKNRDFDSIPDGTWTQEESRLTGQQGPVFRREVTVTYMDVSSGVLITSGSATDLKRIQVRVTWTERNAVREIILTSLIARHL